MNHKNPLQFNFLPEYQKIIIDGFNQFDKEITSLAEKYHQENNCRAEINRIILWISYGIINDLLSLKVSKITVLFSTEHALLLKDYFLTLSSPLPARSRSYDLVPRIKEMYSNEFNILSYNFIDYFYTTVGKINRKEYHNMSQSTGDKITPSEEVFFGLISPTQLFPNLSPFELGEMMPFFNAKIYQKINLISSLSQLHGKMKEVRRIDGHNRYALAGRLGFIEKPPTYKRIRFFFQTLNFLLLKTGK